MSTRPLTPAEHTVAEHAASGRTNEEIARELGLSTKTVEWYLTRIYHAVGVRSRTELAANWEQISGVPPESERPTK